MLRLLHSLDSNCLGKEAHLRPVVLLDAAALFYSPLSFKKSLENVTVHPIGTLTLSLKCCLELRSFLP